MAVFPAFGPGAETHSLTTNEGVTMRVVIEGTGPDVVFIPGGDATADGYSQIFARLTDRFRCISYDPRGAGQTVSPAPPWSMEDYARDCAAVIDAFCGGKAVVSGLSLGGLVTQATAIAFPDKVRLAIPMGTAA
jgi:3-oxoadipate enol-lactonase